MKEKFRIYGNVETFSRKFITGKEIQMQEINSQEIWIAQTLILMSPMKVIHNVQSSL
jgi:hypothetical protein